MDAGGVRRRRRWRRPPAPLREEAEIVECEAGAEETRTSRRKEAAIGQEVPEGVAGLVADNDPGTVVERVAHPLPPFLQPRLSDFPLHLRGVVGRKNGEIDSVEGHAD